MNNHLSYDSLEAWAEGEKLPKDWIKYSDIGKRNLWWKQFAELKQHLWSQHISSLSDNEQKEFTLGTHPSLKHDFKELALPFTELLKDALSKIGYNAEVSLGFYHMDRIILFAVLDRAPPGRLRGVPWLFRGFEVKYRFPDTAV